MKLKNPKKAKRESVCVCVCGEGVYITADRVSIVISKE